MSVKDKSVDKQTDNGAMTTQPARMISHDESPFANILDTAKFEHLWRVAQAFASSDLVPEHFRGKPGNCWIGIQMAIRCGVDPFMFLQNCYVVHGRPGIESKLAIALLNASGAIKGRIRYRFMGEGKAKQCTAIATDARTDEEYSQTVTWAMVEAEGWNKKAGSKWLTMPDLMFQYRAALFLIRLHYPEVLMGLQTAEEIEDIAANEDRVPLRRGVDMSVEPAKSLESLTAKLTDSASPPTPDQLPDLNLDELERVLSECQTPMDVAAVENQFALPGLPAAQREALHNACKFRVKQIDGEAKPKA
jgi:hypothetical protein